jgi:hypothetical protein
MFYHIILLLAIQGARLIEFDLVACGIMLASAASLSLAFSCHEPSIRSILFIVV